MPISPPTSTSSTTSNHSQGSSEEAVPVRFIPAMGSARTFTGSTPVRTSTVSYPLASSRSTLPTTTAGHAVRVREHPDTLAFCPPEGYMPSAPPMPSAISLSLWSGMRSRDGQYAEDSQSALTATRGERMGQRSWEGTVSSILQRAITETEYAALRRAFVAEARVVCQLSCLVACIL